MTKFENIDAATCRQVRDLLDTHLAAINEDTNLHIVVGTMSYDPYRRRMSAKLDIGLREEDGTVVTKEAADFTAHAEAGYWEGITADDLGTKLHIHGDLVTIVGAKPRSRKYPILCAKVPSGTVYKYTASAVARALQAADEVVDTNS